MMSSQVQRRALSGLGLLFLIAAVAVGVSQYSAPSNTGGPSDGAAFGLAAPPTPTVDDSAPDATSRSKIESAPAGSPVVAGTPLIIEAEDARRTNGGIEVEVDHLGYITHGDSAIYGRVEFGRYETITVSYASEGFGGRLEARAGTITGPVVATVDLDWTGSWDRFVTTPPQTVSHPESQELVLVFVNDTHQANNEYLYNIDAVTLK